jgi:phosphoserine phosphatase RsbU/P
VDLHDRVPTTGTRMDPGLAVSTRGEAEFLSDASRRLAGSLNVRRTVMSTLHLVVPYLADWAHVALFESGTVSVTALRPDTGPRPVAAPGRPVTVTVPSGTPEGRGLERIRHTGRTELLHVALDPDPADGLAALVPDPTMREDAAALRPADALGVPLRARGSTIGVLALVRRAGRGFDPADVRLAEELAMRVAVTLDSCRQYEERARMAEALQRSLCPPSLPAIPGMRVASRYRPAFQTMDIGGDFFDVVGADDDWVAVIGDVCGKGIDAAVLTGRSRQSIRTVAHLDRSPARILSVLNDVLYEADSDRFVTIACARVRPDRATGGAVLSVATAGHPAPIVLRADGSVQIVDVHGLLAGVLPHADYAETEVRLGPGDGLLMFTDGIFEARGPQGFYGLQRLHGLLPTYAGADPEALCEAVELSVVEHLAGAAHDDMALLAMACERN